MGAGRLGHLRKDATDGDTTTYASKEALLEASDLTERDVELPALKMTVRVRALPAAYSTRRPPRRWSLSRSAGTRSPP